LPTVAAYSAVSPRTPPASSTHVHPRLPRILYGTLTPADRSPLHTQLLDLASGGNFHALTLLQLYQNETNLAVATNLVAHGPHAESNLRHTKYQTTTTDKQPRVWYTGSEAPALGRRWKLAQAPSAVLSESQPLAGDSRLHQTEMVLTP
jgi:hypothetical protein